MSRNSEVADRLELLAAFLEARGVEYKPQAYRTAAANLRDHPDPVESMSADELAEVDGVGDAIAEKTREYVETGRIEELEAQREQLPVEMAALTRVEGLGPKRVATLYAALGVEDLDDLERAGREGEIREVEGFGETTEENILKGIPFARQAGERERLGDARPLAEDVGSFLDGVAAVEEWAPGGSLRRWKETVGDVDVLAAAPDGTAVTEAFAEWGRADEVVEAGENKASVRVDRTRVDLRVVAPAEFGAALQYFTGSREHNIRLRNDAIEQGLKLNEYGVFDVSAVEDPDAGQRVGDRVAGETEEGVYGALGLPAIPPELREDTGEIAAAAAGELPDLVGGVQGDLHVHTDASDGEAPVATMVEGAAEFGHDYVAVTDHATGPGMVGGVGLDDAAVREHATRVREADEAADIDVFAGIETNIGAEGDLSTADDVLAALDIVVASPHAALDGDGTDRLVAAVEHPHVDVLGHPTGRIINGRQGLAVDAEMLGAAAAEHGVALEVNANPARLDLRDTGVRTAVEAGATVVVNTDAHSTAEYGHVTYGVHTARRGWAEAADVLNARGADGVRDFLG
jgi:DNA polymerase (family 10)